MSDSTYDSTTPAVFLLSTERSGSNLLRSILDTHPDITAPHPIEVTPWDKIASLESMSVSKRSKLVRDLLLRKTYSSQPLNVSINVEQVHRTLENFDEKSHLALQSAIYSEFCEINDASMWVSKSPHLFKWLKESWDFYDNIKYIHLVRDPRDVALSFKNSHVGDHHPYFNATRWSTEQQDIRNFLKEIDSSHIIRYEDILTDSKNEISKLCKFLGKSYHPNMLEFYKTDDAKYAADSDEALENISSPIKEDNFGKFRDQLPNNEVEIVEKVCRAQMDSFGYETIYQPSYLNDIELTEDRYTKINNEILSEKRRNRYKENPTSELKRFMSNSFVRYIILRYGVLSDI